MIGGLKSAVNTRRVDDVGQGRLAYVDEIGSRGVGIVGRSDVRRSCGHDDGCIGRSSDTKRGEEKRLMCPCYFKTVFDRIYLGFAEEKVDVSVERFGQSDLLC